MATLPELKFFEDAPTIVPESTTSLARRMLLLLSALNPRSDAEALKLLRSRFPQSTLSERLSALSNLRR